MLVLSFVVWNGWSLWLFRRHATGLLPGQATYAICPEERFLRRRFGASYDDYTRRVRRWL